MQNFLNNNGISALIATLVIGIGSICIVGTSQYVMGLNGDTIKNLLHDKVTKITNSIGDGQVIIFSECDEDNPPDGNSVSGNIEVGEAKFCYVFSFDDIFPR